MVLFFLLKQAVGQHTLVEVLREVIFVDIDLSGRVWLENQIAFPNVEVLSEDKMKGLTALCCRLWLYSRNHRVLNPLEVERSTREVDIVELKLRLYKPACCVNFSLDVHNQLAGVLHFDELLAECLRYEHSCLTCWGVRRRILF